MRTLNISLLTIATIGLALSSLAGIRSENPLSNSLKMTGKTLNYTIQTEYTPKHKNSDPNIKKHNVQVKVLYAGALEDGNPDFYQIGHCMAIGENNEATLFNNVEDDPTLMTANVPEGCVDLVLLLNKVEGYTNGYPICFAKPDININNDMILTIDPTEATNHYSFKALKSNGEELSLPLYRLSIDPDNPDAYKMELLKEGNAGKLTIKTSYCSSKYGPLLTLAQYAEIIDIEGDVPTLDALFNIYTNDAEGYYAIQTISYQEGEDTNEFIALIPQTINQFSISNDVNDFFDIEIPFIEQSKAAREQEPQPYEPYIGCFPEFEMKYYNYLIGSKNMNIPAALNPGKEQKKCRKIRINMPKKSDLFKNLTMEFKPKAFNMVARFQQDTIWLPDSRYMIHDKSVTSCDFGRMITVTPDRNISLNGQILKSFLSTRLSSTYPLPYHPYFPDYSQMQSLDYNTTQPYVTSIFATSESGNYHLYTYLDNLGGKISTYEYAQDYKLKHDGNLILDSKDYDDLIDRSEALNQALDETRESGTYELELTTFKGDIGGVDSRTTFTAKFGGMGADETAPSLQILNFINKENEITNHFDNPSDGLIRLTGGDFELRPEGLENTDAFVKTTETITPVIEYSPYARESWEALNPELQDIEAEACYGDSWTVNLKDMNVRQTNSWYDLRITMTDATGNSISQVISPAFYIGNGTGIKSTYGEAQIHVKGNDIYGPDDMQVCGPDGRRYGTKGLTAGIYVVRSGKTSKKVIIR